ncbi:hypothetical protein SpCBS45565_g08180 [Spizellomyces sp. 'palustris']|nr:hypothetical protein SpCBS45565_g08180 [Spizellomyces sp. 'palustris']
MRSPYCRLLFLLYVAFVVSAQSQQENTPILLFSRTKDDSDTVAGTRLRLTPEGSAFLGSLHAPFAIVSAVGPTRTGKSFLLNQVVHIANSSDASSKVLKSANPFPVGGGVASKTHGLWIWPKPITMGGVPTYLIDSEGLHGVESVQTIAYEVELFVHASMLASAVLYNTWAPVDAAHVRNLKALVAFSRLFMMDVAAATVDSNNTLPLTVPGEEHDLIAIPEHLDPPNLHWAVQNFNKYALRKAGWTAKEFLDQLITKDTFLEDANVDVRFLQQQFGTIELVPIVRPSDDDAKMAGDGDEIGWADFKEEYRKDVTSLHHSVSTHIAPKRLNGRNLSGAELVKLITLWDKEAPIQIPEHTNWARAVQLKLEHEAKRLLRAFDAAAAKLPITMQGDFATYTKKLQALADVEMAKMKASVKNLGEDPRGVMVIAFLEKELAHRIEQWENVYITWAETEIKAKGDAAHDEVMDWLLGLRDTPDRICKWWFTTSLKEALHKRIKMERDKIIKPMIKHFPSSYDHDIMHHIVGAGSGSAQERNMEIDTAVHQILLTHATCPNPFQIAVEVIQPLWNAYKTAFLAGGGLLSLGVAIQWRHTLSTMGVRLTHLTGTLLAHAYRHLIILGKEVIKISVPLLGIIYLLWIGSQVAILGRDVSNLRWNVRGLSDEMEDAMKALRGFARGFVTFVLVFGSGVAFLVMPWVWRRIWRGDTGRK